MKLRFKTFSMLLAAGATLALTGCKDDMMGDDQLAQEYNGKYYHITTGIALPGTGTRSATDGDYDDEGNETNGGGQTNSDQKPTDYEYGWAYENEIRTMILLYTNSNDEYIAHSVISGLTKAPEENITSNYDYVVVGEVKHQDLEDAYTKGALKDYDPEATDGSGEIHVYAFCNYTDRLASLFAGAGIETKNTWREWEGIINEDASPIGHTPSIQNTIWAPRSFLMTNARIANVKFPAELSEWDNYADKSTPWILNSDGTQKKENADADPDPIYVERTAARIDFRDGSDEETPANTYVITTDDYSYGDWNTDEPGTGALEVVNIELTRMALVNMSKEFYYLRRVSPNGTNAGWVYGGVETRVGGRTPYVVDNDYTFKTGGGYNIEYAEKAFNFPLFRKLTAEEIAAKNAKRRIVGWDPTDIAIDDIQKPTTDPYTYNYEGWYCDIINDVLNNDLHDKDTWNGSKYNIWRYVTENTLPSADAQQVQQSVGVVFKGRIAPGKDAENVTNDKIYEYISKKAVDVLNNVDETKANSPLLYSFENRLFSGYLDIITAANNIDGEASTLYGAVSRILNKWHAQKTGENSYTFNYDPTSQKEDDMLDVKMAYLILTADNQTYTDKEGNTYKIDSNLTDDIFRTYAPGQNIAVYQASVEKDKDGKDVWGYYCYYFYWNRHNDNQKSGLMGPMEFATVRNNVYKLAVTKIDRLGHPTTPDDDPDPVEEKDPDEPPTNYMRVDVEVLPWVVRVNDIEF